ncbi:hypothetical protein Ana3638_09030 [Anaerocolumna sedimenticola]|uniref:Uncharacterized protein n=1 Tax=Anaerocolumna sedimenticola TaxID=2696063 RepID=A0A6P1TL86_9FIRM|nr:hypothetical protein [Anaerocolumna sedimenticola]QHQ60892.1 hypothetical protein Ana3638_09030 [Anaerocolumna sedimenticola]
MKLTSIFLKYCLKYFLAFLIVLICCIPIAKLSYKIVEQQVMKMNELKLKEGVNEIEQNISKMYLLAQSMSQDLHFDTLIRNKGKLSSSEYLQLGYARQNLVNTRLIYTFPCFSFMLFRDNDLFVSSSQCSEQFSAYYGKFFKVYDHGLIEADKFKSSLLSKNSIYSFWTVDRLEYCLDDKTQILENAILFMVKANSKMTVSTSHVMTFVIQPAELIEMLLTEECRKEGFVQVINTSDGEILLNYGENAEVLKDAADKDQVRYGVIPIGF